MRHSQLRAFHNVALQGGFSRAAEALHVAQPSVSDQVRKLEQAYDVLLFHRDARQVRLTEAGEALFRLTRTYFEAEEEIADFLAQSRAEMQGALRILADSALHVTSLVAAFRKSHPGVFVSLRIGNTRDVVTGVRTYDADVGVVADAEKAADLDIVELGASPILALVAKKSTDAKVRSFDFETLSGKPLVFREPGSRTRAAVETAALAAGVKLEPAIEVEGREALREIVASGAGVGFISEAELGHDSRLATVPVVEAGMVMSEAIVTAKARADVRVIRAFLKTVDASR